MKAVIPTAGYGKRLQPFTHSIPKVLLQVADRPILGHIIEKLRRENITNITFVVGYLGEQIEAYVREEYPELNSRFVEQAEALGLGHAISLTEEACGRDDEPLLIVLGDTVIEADLSVLHHAQTDMIGVREVENPKRFGVVELDGDRITGMIEKPDVPPSNLAIVGIYYIQKPGLLYRCLSSNIQDGVLTKGEVQLTDALQAMLSEGREMRKLDVQGWFDCGTPEALLKTNAALLESDHRDTVDEIRRHYPGNCINGPVFIGPGAQVSNSIIGPGVTIARKAVVEHSIILNSIINEGARVSNVHLQNSIIGNYAEVRERSYRLYVGDKSEVSFSG